MLQLILLGCPTVIFFSLLGTYLLLQVHVLHFQQGVTTLLQGQFLTSLMSFSTPTFLVLIAMTVWLTVLAAYWALGSKVRAGHCNISTDVSLYRRHTRTSTTRPRPRRDWPT